MAEAWLTQHNIEEVQAAKGTTAAGIRRALEMTEADASEVAQVDVTGAFGSFLDIAAALVVGMFPRFPNARFRQVRHAAAVGPGGCWLRLPSASAPTVWLFRPITGN